MNNDTLTFKADRNVVLKDFLINECHVSKRLLTKLKQTENGSFLNLDPGKTKAIIDSVGKEVEKLENLGKSPIIITSPIVRIYFKRLTEDYYRDLVVVSYNEVETNVELQSVGMVTDR